MDCVSSPKTVSRMDAGFEPPWMGLWRVFGDDTQFMPRCQCMYLTPLFTTDINRMHLAETRREPTYTDVGNADIAGAYICHPWGLGIRIRPPRTLEVQVLQEQKPAMRLMVVDSCPRFMSLTVK